MAWKVEFPVEAEADLELIFDHLFDSYVSFGESADAAFARASGRVEGIIDAADRIGTAPRRGTIRREIAPALRNLTIDNAIYWFDLDERRKAVRILAVFFGGQDHVRHMLARLLG